MTTMMMVMTMIRNNYNIYNLMVILFLWNTNMFPPSSSVLVSAYINPKLLKETASPTTTLDPTIDPRNVNVSNPRKNQKQQQQQQRERIPSCVEDIYFLARDHHIVSKPEPFGVVVGTRLLYRLGDISGTQEQ
eukprot:CAMPEP_0170912628 /NCGR_PEP_ID=MMETSP0735-20130129/4482_1 /TAXON_ID=186038 /ORGANISM="Fragilariopsis kerguelensis, Strain L26-C5" /LENGTH=132 /DNA_ID=CAMNT_0011309915 /DNA_START=790 /DNA_END=1191 /DNA_ORIENTATION=-